MLFRSNNYKTITLCTDNSFASGTKIYVRVSSSGNNAVGNLTTDDGTSFTDGYLNDGDIPTFKIVDKDADGNTLGTELDVRMIDENDILLVSDERPEDETTKKAGYINTGGMQQMTSLPGND